MKKLYVLLLLIIFACEKENYSPITPSDRGTVTDIDGNVYKTITLGGQTWMAENLKVTKYRNGDPIQNITTSQESWRSTTSGAYCWYNNNVQNKDVYGGLYNWFTISDNRGIAPDGWHIPTEAEWNTLINLLGGEYKAWDQLWMNGSSEFNALPGGQRSVSNEVSLIFQGSAGGDFVPNGTFWSSSINMDQAIMYYVGESITIDSSKSDKKRGCSVRCVKNK